MEGQPVTALKAVTAPKGARRRMVTVAALAAGAALVLSGCGAGQISQTAEQVAAVNGNYANINEVALRNVHIVFPGEGNTNTKGGNALIALSMINNSESVPDELTSITTDLGTVKITPPPGDPAFIIAPQQTVVAATTGHASAKPEMTPTKATDKPAIDPEANSGLIEITGLTKDIIPGLTYTVTFNFKQNGTVQVQVPVDAGSSDRHESGDAESASGGHPASGGH
jgi:copper(I)-binding protein